MAREDLILIHAPSVYDFRREFLFYGPVSDLVPSTPVFEMYPFGFMTMERGASGWVIRSWDRAGHPVTTCTLFARKASCTPLAAP